MNQKVFIVEWDEEKGDAVIIEDRVVSINTVSCGRRLYINVLETEKLACRRKKEVRECAISLLRERRDLLQGEKDGLGSEIVEISKEINTLVENIEKEKGGQ